MSGRLRGRVVRTGAHPQTPQLHIALPEALCRRKPTTSFLEGLGSASCLGAAVAEVGAQAAMGNLPGVPERRRGGC